MQLTPRSIRIAIVLMYIVFLALSMTITTTQESAIDRQIRITQEKIAREGYLDEANEID